MIIIYYMITPSKALMPSETLKNKGKTMNIKDNFDFAHKIYDLGDFFRKYHNGIMMNEEFTIEEIKDDFTRVKDSVKELEAIIKEM